MSKEVESVTIPVIEEALTVGREAVETGVVRVRAVPEFRTERVVEALARTEAVVERIPVGREIDAVPPIREEDDTIVVPVVEERLVKKLFLVEEVRLSRRRTTEQVEQDIELRSQRVVVEREESAGAQPEQE